MKHIWSAIIISLSLIACGSHDDYQKTSGNYQVRKDLSAVGSLTLRFEQVYLYKSVAVGEGQSNRCKEIADDYMKSTGVEFIPESLKMSIESPRKHCVRRNILKQCESSQYIYAFNCSFKTL